MAWAKFTISTYVLHDANVTVLTNSFQFGSYVSAYLSRGDKTGKSAAEVEQLMCPRYPPLAPAVAVASTNYVAYSLRTFITNGTGGATLRPFKSPGVKLTAIPLPSLNWMLSDCDAFIAALHAASGLGDSMSGHAKYTAIKVQHENLRNYVFFDGHVENQRTNFHTLQ
jgi:prepilin-type processing-associated H-X9-DG protein